MEKSETNKASADLNDGENSIRKHTFIKICGITRESDAKSALSYGVDALGLMFFANSPRFVTIEQAIKISHVISDKALKVGLFVNAEADIVRDVLAQVPLDILQFHGDETPDYCRQFKRPYWKALRVQANTDISKQVDAFDSAVAILLDAWHPDQYGGTGVTFDWELLGNVNVNQNLILAGGLNPDNAAEAVKKVRPWGIDVSSGVEESPGIKSAKLMKQFIEEVRSV